MAAAPISAAELDQRVTLQTRETTQDAVGQESEAWVSGATVWARARPLRGREFFAAGATQSQETIVFGIRYRPGLTSGMRVLWRNVAYELTAEPVNVDGGNHTLELYCTGGRP
jgi:SPP1 family predicted phage head-tail adaptor